MNYRKVLVEKTNQFDFWNIFWMRDVTPEEYEKILKVLYNFNIHKINRQQVNRFFETAIQLVFSDLSLIVEINSDNVFNLYKVKHNPSNTILNCKFLDSTLIDALNPTYHGRTMIVTFVESLVGKIKAELNIPYDIENPCRNLYNLFLDSTKFPSDVFDYTKDSCYLKLKWEIVRSYNEFVNKITNDGLPELISFGHDLSTLKTGHHCAEWLAYYCLNNSQKLPSFKVHAIDSVGKRNIIELLNNFLKKSD